MPLRSFLLRALGLALVAAAPGVAAEPFGLDDVAQKARGMASQPFRDPRGEVPGWLLEIGYDQWRDIRFRTDRALWRDLALPFEAQFFHPGLYYDRVVRVNEIDAKGVKSVPFSPDLFDYGRNEFASRVPQALRPAGRRVHHPIRTPERLDEFLVFLGATYLRAVGAEADVAPLVVGDLGEPLRHLADRRAERRARLLLGALRDVLEVEGGGGERRGQRR